MSAIDKDRLLALTLEKRLGVSIPPSAANVLRRAGMTLSRWAELECGDSNGWAIERDEETGKPSMFRYSERLPMHRHSFPVADRERGALRRVAALCASYGLHYFHQTDPRGCSLYVSREPLTDSNHSQGAAIS